MYTKTLVTLLATGLVGQAIAGPRHGLQHAHQKKALYTDLTTVTDWVTVTVYEGEESTTSVHKTFYTNSAHRVKHHSSSASTSKTSTLSPVAQASSTAVAVKHVNPPSAKPPVPSSTTSVTPVVNSPAPVVEAPVPTTQPPASSAPPSPPPPPPPPASSTKAASPPAPVDTNGNSAGSGSGSGSTGGAKRGLVYNNAQLLPSFLNAGTKVSWTYNWGQYDDSGTNLEFCPTLWGLKLDFAETWPANAQKAIDAGSKCLFSFNEPELDSQANMSPELSAQKHIELLNPFSGKARIGTPAITNGGGPDHGIGWLQRYFTACGGSCAVDFVNVHIYGVDTNTFLSHLLDVHTAFNKPVWITEFAFDGSDDQINSQLETVIDQIETNSTYSFVERYAYFMVQDGTMIHGNTPSAYGNTFAYGA